MDRNGGFPKKRTLNKRTRGLFLLDRRELVGTRMEFWKGGTSRTQTQKPCGSRVAVRREDSGEDEALRKVEARRCQA